jgi:hypothetical protein|tara:strand:+ start:99 stop:308 length:210 start_codon:yes stop_codon:yes gene_type:complete
MLEQYRRRTNLPSYILKESIMGEWLSNNVLLPLMYLLIDVIIAGVVLLLAMHLLEMILNSKIFKNIGKR